MSGEFPGPGEQPEPIDERGAEVSAPSLDAPSDVAVEGQDLANSDQPPGESDQPPGEEAAPRIPLTDDEWRRAGKVVTRIAFAWGVNRNDVPDLVQDALLDIARGGGISVGADGIRNVEGWAGTVGVRRIMDYRRRQYRLPATLYWTDDEFEGSPISDSASASLPVDTNVLADPVLLEVVEGLSFNQRTALLMRADGISQRAIAAELGISVGALKAALDRAKNNVGDRLRARLEQGEAIDPSIVERLFEDAPEDDSPE